MQHRFCLVDDKVLMTGTLDWGDDRSADNWNYVYITSVSQLVEPVKREFYQMWGEYSSDIVLVEKSEALESGEQSDTKSEEKSNTEIKDVETCGSLEPNTMQETTVTPEVLIVD